MNAEEYVKQTDDTILQQLTTLPETNSELKAAKKIANDYQDRNSSNAYLRKQSLAKSHLEKTH